MAETLINGLKKLGTVLAVGLIIAVLAIVELI